MLGSPTYVEVPRQTGEVMRGELRPRVTLGCRGEGRGALQQEEQMLSKIFSSLPVL